ncbi:hypothetical protein ACJVC5_14350 [Peredibacter sp. HCB2-198]|uniref:hypothetical protein n=1 Tax=Peredibacter sp. HCB2-198 TaxID=3383025 RepID=UPI0038B4259B
MIKIVGLSLFLLSFSAQALVPVEGILMGEAQTEIQTDPLQKVFSDIYDKSKEGENKKVKLYQSTYESGQLLVESCGYLAPSTYATPWQEKQAKRAVAATLQYIGIDTTIKAIGAYAKKMEINEGDYKRLTNNLLKNYCSKNLTIFSLRNLEQSFQHYYQNPRSEMVPTVESSPFATMAVKTSTEKEEARSREFDQVIKNFRAFCSWGGEVEDYRMLTPYLNNRYIMSFVFKNMSGVQDQVTGKEQKVVAVPDSSTVQVACTELICRKENLTTFRQKFPVSVGSTGISTDLAKLYCHHFRFQNDPQGTIPEVKAWIKAREIEDPIFETSQFIALMTGVPDLFFGVNTYQDIPLLVRSSVDERWTLWARDVLNSFSKDMLYEEALKVKVEPRTDRVALATKGFKVELTVTMGEMDRLMKDHDKLGLTFDLKLTKNYLRSLKTKWHALAQEVDLEGQKKFKEDVAHYIDLQLREKSKFFTQKMWNEDFSRLVAEELINQVLIYQGPLFESYQEEVLRVPVKFSYGLFALSYLRYKADAASGRLKLNL